MIINANDLFQAYSQKHKTNTYSYVSIRNLLKGVKGKLTKKEIQAIRKIMNEEVTQIDTILEKLENE